MNKIIQITTDINDLYALTEDGKVYYRDHKVETITPPPDSPSKTKRITTFFWKEVEEK